MSGKGLGAIAILSIGAIAVALYLFKAKQVGAEPAKSLNPWEQMPEITEGTKYTSGDIAYMEQVEEQRATFDPSPELIVDTERALKIATPSTEIMHATLENGEVVTYLQTTWTPINEEAIPVTTEKEPEKIIPLVNPIEPDSIALVYNLSNPTGTQEQFEATAVPGSVYYNPAYLESLRSEGLPIPWE